MDKTTGKRKPPPLIPDLEGPPLVIPTLSTGLGTRYFNTLNENKDRLHQVDATTGVTETKGSVRARAIQVASGMRKRGLKENQVVIICSKTHLDQTIALLACLFLGVIIAPVHYDLPFDEFKRVILTLQPKLAFCGMRSARLVDRIIKEKGLKCDIFVFRGDGKDFLDFNKFFENKPDPNFTSAVVADPLRTTAFVICTHGTECFPKLVAMSHYCIFTRYYPMLETYCKKTEKLLSFFPLSWMVQVLVTCICFETQGILIYAGQFTERGVCKYIHDLRIEYAFLESDFVLRVVKNAPIQDFDLSCLKVMYVGGVPISPAQMTKIFKNFPGVRIIHAYKMTEAGIIASITEQEFFKYGDKLNSVGKLNPGVTIRVVEVNKRKILGPDNWGELLVKTPGLMLGYFRDQQATARAFSRGFFKTGDIVLYDESGFLYIRGRVGQIITRNDHSFPSSEIEEVLLMHFAVAEAAVISTTSEIVACIVKKPEQALTANTLFDYVSDILPDYKRPDRIEFYDSLPKTLHGIVKKYLLKESAIKLIREESFYHSEVVN